MTEFAIEVRQYCRNPKCRSKLPRPVSNEREAFCTKGCHSSFYRKRCLICEQPMERKNERQLVCGKRKCRNGLQARSTLGRYLAPSGIFSHSKKPVNKGPKVAIKTDRAPAWQVVAAGRPITANQYHCAVVGAEETSEESNRINAAHWRAAKTGTSGYRCNGSGTL